MAHQITNVDSFGEVREGGERAWHGLGIEIRSGLTAAQAFEEVGLGWETEMRPIFSEFGGKRVEINTHKAHVRSDTGEVLGVLGEGYRPISNQKLAEFTDSLVGAGKQVSTETAGSLRRGRCVFTLVRLPKDIAVTDEDVLKQYVLVRNSHDGSSAFQVYPTSIRVVCANTLRWSERDAARGLRFVHGGNMKAKLSQARLVLGLITDETERFEAMVRILAATPINKSSVRDYFCAVHDRTFGVLPDPDSNKFAAQLEKRDAMIARWEANMEDARQSMSGVRGTMWAAYNAVSQWHDHERGRFGNIHESEARVHSNFFGTSGAHKRFAFNIAVKAATGKDLVTV